eukprot:989037-Amphidinium_carterae.2
MQAIKDKPGKKRRLGETMIWFSKLVSNTFTSCSATTVVTATTASVVPVSDTQRPMLRQDGEKESQRSLKLHGFGILYNSLEDAKSMVEHQDSRRKQLRTILRYEQMETVDTCSKTDSLEWRLLFH